MPSEAYYVALADCQRHHAASKTYSGRLLRPHAAFIKAMIDVLGCKSVLDYGCGKGSQYDWVMPQHACTIEEYWGVPVFKYDPAWPPYAAEPEGTFDLVICTHTLGAIPAVDQIWAIDRLYSLANKGIYVAEKISTVFKKKVVVDKSSCLAIMTAESWMQALRRRSGLDVVLATRDKEVGIIKHHRMHGRDWVPIKWPDGVRTLDISWA